jgi:hypothetical protein
MANRGSGLAVFALIVALGAVGLSAYQGFIAAPRTLVSSNPIIISLNTAGWKDIPDLNVTYNANPGDLVLIEFSCMCGLDIVPFVSQIGIYFVLDSVKLLTSNYIILYGDSSEDSQAILDAASMRYFIPNQTAGAHNVTVACNVEDGGSASYIQSCVLSVHIYR